MASSLDKLKALSSKLENRLEKKSNAKPPISTTVEASGQKNILSTFSDKSLNNVVYDSIQHENLLRVQELYEKLKIFEKSPDFNNIFSYKAMNLSGIGLKEEDFGELREGRYIQIIAITYEPDKNGKKKAKNISLGYFGKTEALEENLKNEIIEFVLRWRYEKAFQNVEHYRELISRIDVSQKTSDTLF